MRRAEAPAEVWTEIEEHADGSWSWRATAERDGRTVNAGPALGYASKSEAAGALHAWLSAAGAV